MYIYVKFDKLITDKYSEHRRKILAKKKKLLLLVSTPLT